MTNRETKLTEDDNPTVKRIWTPGEKNPDFTTEENKAIEKEFLNQMQEEHVPEIRPSEQEQIMAVLSGINQKYVGKSITPQIKVQIEKDIVLAMEAIGFVVKVSFNPLAQYQAPEVEILRRTSFDIDEAGKLIREVEQRGGYKGDFNWRK